MATRHQLLDQARGTLASPAQRRLRVAARRRFNQGIEVAQQRRVFVGQLLAATAFGANAAQIRGQRCVRRGHRELAQAGIDGGARQAHGVRHHRDTPTTECTGLDCRPQPQRRLVQAPGKRAIFFLDHLVCIHA